MDLKKISVILIVITLLVGGFIYFYFFRDKSGIKGTCKFITDCDGSSKIECFQDWLKKSNCFTEEYIQNHFKNFRMGGTIKKEEIIVTFDFVIDGYNVCNGGYPDCGVIISNNNGFRVETVYGPLKEYQLNVTEGEAVEILKKDKDCADFNSITLKVWDQFNKRRGDGFTGYEYDKYGLHWKVWAGYRCGMPCMVNTMNGNLFKGEYVCE